MKTNRPTYLLSYFDSSSQKALFAKGKKMRVEYFQEESTEKQNQKSEAFTLGSH